MCIVKIILFLAVICSIFGEGICLQTCGMTVWLDINYFETFDETELSNAFIVGMFRGNGMFALIEHCDLDNFPNLLWVLSTYSKLTNLTIVNSTMTRVKFLIYKFDPLTSMRFTGNSISTFDMELVTNLVDLDLTFNNMTSFRLGVGDRLFLRTINVSNNNLVEVDILSRLRDLKTLDLSNNKLMTLDFVKGVVENVHNLQLDITNNALQCSSRTTINWLILASANVTLTSEAMCRFWTTNNTYLIRELGLHVINESGYFDSMWSSLLLQTHSQFDLVRFYIDILADATAIRWAARNQLDRIFFLTYKSAGGLEVQTETVNMTQGIRTIPSSNNIVEVCFSTQLLRPTNDGPVGVNVTMKCSTISRTSAGDNLYKYLFYGVLAFSIFYIVASICVCVWRYRCLRKWRNSCNTHVQMVEMDTNSINQSRETVMTNDIYILGEVTDNNRISSKNELRKKVEYDAYLPMDSVEAGKSTNKEDDNIYDAPQYDLIKDRPVTFPRNEPKRVVDYDAYLPMDSVEAGKPIKEDNNIYDAPQYDLIKDRPVTFPRNEPKRVVDYDAYLPMDSVEAGKPTKEDDNIYDAPQYDLIKDSSLIFSSLVKDGDNDNIYEECE